MAIVNAKRSAPLEAETSRNRSGVGELVRSAADAARFLRLPWVLGLLVCFLGSGALADEEREERLNVILINIDNHDKGSLSYFGNTFIETPNIDRLFEQGYRLQNFRTTSRCTASRSALMTGRYHARNGALGTGGAWGQTVDGVRTVAHVLRDGGYQTAMFGKWHLGDSKGLRPEDRGFEEVCSFENGAYLGGAVVRPGYNGSPRTGEAHRFNHNGVYRVYEGFRTDVWFREAGRFLEEQRDPNKPFFIYLATVTAHGPNFGPQELQAYYKKKYESEEHRAVRERFEAATASRGLKLTPTTSYPYDHAAEVANLDQNIGRLLAMLEELELLDKTVVIYMSDGSGGGPASIRLEEKQLSQNPTTVLWPGQAEGRDIESPLVANIDVLPTLAEICGVALSKKHQASIDGQSFASLFGVEGATSWTPRPYISDHQSSGGREDIQKQMILRPFSRTQVTLPDGAAITWSGGKPAMRGASAETLEAAEQAYAEWLERVLKDFPLGAYVHTHLSDQPVFLRSYPIADGPGGTGLQAYFLLYVHEDGLYEVDTNVTDYFGAERTEEKVKPARFTFFRKTSDKPLPVGFDEVLNGYRVLPETLRSAFEEVASAEVTEPIPLQAGRYLIHQRTDRPERGSKIRVQRRE